MPELLRNYFWAGMLVWAALYCSDYYLTLTCARLYQAGVKDKITFEGSYEITPYFQRDIDTLRTVSPRFLLALGLMLTVLSLIWFLARNLVPEAYAIAVGALVGVQLTIHMRHLRNLGLFRAMRKGEIDGRIQYPRPLMLRLSAYEMMAFVGFFLVLFLFTTNWFVLGCAMGCLSVAAKHSKWSQKAAAAKPESPSSEASTT